MKVTLRAAAPAALPAKAIPDAARPAASPELSFGGVRVLRCVCCALCRRGRVAPGSRSCWPEPPATPAEAQLTLLPPPSAGDAKLAPQLPAVTSRLPAPSLSLSQEVATVEPVPPPLLLQQVAAQAALPPTVADAAPGAPGRKEKHAGAGRGFGGLPKGRVAAWACAGAWWVSIVPKFGDGGLLSVCWSTGARCGRGAVRRLAG